ncbi:hypothetical protein [Halorubrum sp. SD626R]|jgi:hypothetical protein|nr:hypothetical protein [Halorubrum sp. SD626R]
MFDVAGFLGLGAYYALATRRGMFATAAERAVDGGGTAADGD